MSMKAEAQVQAEAQAESFGSHLKALRKDAGYGLRRFADLIAIAAPNLCDIEHDRRPMPPDKLEDAAEALAIHKGSDDWERFFDLAKKSDELPADVRRITKRRLIPVLLRTIDNKQLTDADIQRLVDVINRE